MSLLTDISQHLYSSPVNFLFISVCVLYIVNRLLGMYKSKLPPGPVGLPLVGYYPFLSKELHKDFTKLAKKYGDVFGLYIGNSYVVVLNSYTAVKENLNKPAFLGKPKHSSLNLIPNSVGFSALSGPAWQEQRKFSILYLNKKGFGSQDMDNYVKKEIESLLKKIDEYKGQPFLVHHNLTTSVCNIIWFLLFGKPIGDENRRKFLEIGIKTMSNVSQQSPVMTVKPWLTNLFKHFGSYENELKDLKELNKIMWEQLWSRKDRVGDNNDFVEEYLNEIKKKNEARKEELFTDKMLIGNLQGIFLGATEATLTSLSWAYLLMAGFPEVQKKVHKEIDEAIGDENSIEWKDHTKLPYTEAVLMEAQRWRTVSPLSGLRYTLGDTLAGNFKVSKNTTVVVNLWAVHNDPKHWYQPEKFNPERFLDEETNQVLMDPHFMAFSIGKRNCPGECFATVEIFLYFTQVLRKYEILVPNGSTPDLDHFEQGLTLRPISQKLCFKKRK